MRLLLSPKRLPIPLLGSERMTRFRKKLKRRDLLVTCSKALRLNRTAPRSLLSRTLPDKRQFGGRRFPRLRFPLRRRSEPSISQMSQNRRWRHTERQHKDNNPEKQRDGNIKLAIARSDKRA